MYNTREWRGAWSGLSARSRKPWAPQGAREFESRPLRMMLMDKITTFFNAKSRKSREIGIGLPRVESTQKKVMELLGKERLPKRSLLDQYKPKLEWYLRKELATGIHGISHEARVVILQELITSIIIAGNPHEEVNINREALRWASVCHDLRRIDDHEDYSHGNRAAQFIQESLSEIIPNDILPTVVDIILGHVPPDHTIPQDKMTFELRVFKDADGLDRVRINDLDPKYLRNEASTLYLVNVAEELLIKSYQKIHALNNQHDFDSQWNAVMDAAIEIGILQP